MEYNVNSPLISVIIPVYNVEDYIERCLDSVLEQTYKNLEIILVDDGSTDNSGEICDEYAKKDNRIRVIHKQNGGVSSARNLGLDACKGEYISFVDGDDYVSTDYILALYNQNVENNADVSTCALVCSDSFSAVFSLSGDDAIVYTSNEAIKDVLYQNRIDNAIYCTLFKSSVISGIRFDESLSMGEDLVFKLACLEKATKVSYQNDITYCYFQRQTSAINGNFKVQYMNTLYLLEKMFKENKDSQNALASRIVSISFNYLKMVNGNKKQFKNEIKYLYKTIKCYRRIVIMDANARKKAKLASLMSYISIGFTNRVNILLSK